MRKSEVPRRSSAFEDLFAERQVYLRSGLTSRYVVVSRPLQIAVTIGVGLIVAGWPSPPTARSSATSRRPSCAGSWRWPKRVSVSCAPPVSRTAR